jgi:hypothetical protein
MPIYSLPKHTINDDGCSKVYSNCINMLLKTSKFKYRLWGRNLIFPLYLTQTLCYNKKTLASTMHTSLCHTHLNALNFFKTVIFKIFEYVHPWQSCTQLVFSVVCALALLRHPRRNFSIDIGHWALSCLASKRWCVSGIMWSLLAIRCFFMPLSSQVLLWLEIVLFLLVIRVHHLQGQVPRISRGRDQLNIVREITMDQ